MRIRREHIIYTDEQIAGLLVFVIDDNDPEGPHLAQNAETKQLAAFVRESFAEEDEETIRRELEVIRFDWLSVLGYDIGELDPE